MIPITYHMPTTCEVCPKPLWHMFKPPPALECRSKLFLPHIKEKLISFLGCRLKVHKEHFDRREELIAPCKVNYDPNSAKELLLLAASQEEQQQWVSKLRKKIEKSGYAANQDARSSPRSLHSSSSVIRKQSSISSKSSSLPPRKWMNEQQKVLFLHQIPWLEVFNHVDFISNLQNVCTKLENNNLRLLP